MRTDFTTCWWVMVAAGGGHSNSDKTATYISDSSVRWKWCLMEMEGA